jgi:hypothetical protein
MQFPSNQSCCSSNPSVTGWGYSGCGNQYPIVPGSNPALQTWNGQAFVVADGSAQNRISLPFLQVNGGAATYVVGADNNGVWSYYNPNLSPALAGGSAGQVPWQISTNVTGFTATGTNGQLLQSGATNSPTWIAPNNLLVTATGSTTARTLANRFADVVNVKDFGANPTGVIDSYTAFQNAINSLPSGGGTIVVPTGTYLINTQPTWGSKSIFWDIDVNAVFTGTATGYSGSFGTIATNTGNVAAGPWVQSQTTQAPAFSGAAVNAATFEMLAPSSVATGQYVALYAGASGSAASINNNVWAANTLVEAASGATGAYFGLEIDVVSNSLPAITRGILISGYGTQDADAAIEIDRNTIIGSGVWFYGITTKKTYKAFHINVDSYLQTGISFSNSSTFINSLFSGKQFLNNTNAIVVQRFTDTSPTGTFFQCVNAANSAVLASIDVNGTVFSLNGIYTNGGFLRVNNSANTITYFNASTTSLNSNLLSSSTSYANDTAAAAGGVAVGQFYRNGSVVQIRVT